MNRRAHIVFKMSLLAAVCSTTAAPAWAYLDPGTGSLLLQSLLGSLAIAAAVFARFRSHIAHYLSKLRRKRK